MVNDCLVQRQVRNILLGQGLENMSKMFFRRMEAKVKQLVVDACYRAKENGRKTVMYKDV